MQHEFKLEFEQMKSDALLISGWAAVKYTGPLDWWVDDVEITLEIDEEDEAREVSRRPTRDEFEALEDHLRKAVSDRIEDARRQSHD